MGTLGSYLREAREAREIDLRDAAQQTRISINYLKAIEDEEFSKLPGEVFVRGFLKNYARFLQLPEDEVIKRYTELRKPPKTPVPQAGSSIPPSESAKPSPTIAQTAEPERKQRSGINLEFYIWAAVAVIALVAFILTALPERHPARKTEDHAVSRVTPTAALPAAPAIAPKAEKLYLDIVAIEDTWVLVRTDASPQKKAVLKKGERVTWSADERFLLSYSAVGAVELVLNGNVLTVKGPKNAVVRDLVIAAQGIAYQKVESEQPPAPRKPKPVTLATPTPQQSPQRQAPQSAVPPVSEVPREQQHAPFVAPIFSQ